MLVVFNLRGSMNTSYIEDDYYQDDDYYYESY